MADELNIEQEFGFRRRLRTGLWVTCMLVFAIGVWSATAQLSSAVIAQGTIVVSNSIKKVQHLYGGIVAKINVKNGDLVHAGDVVVRLDDTQMRAEFGVILAEITALTARRSRLSAQRDNNKRITFPADLSGLSPNAGHVMKEEMRIFYANIKSREDQKAQLQLRIGQLQQEINGLVSQRDAKAVELKLIGKELQITLKLFRRKLVARTRVYSLQRDETRIAGEHGGLVANIARAKGKISEIKLQILSIDHTAMSDAQKELRELEARLATLAERRVAAQDRLNRVKLHAPLSGIVHEQSVHTVGGVINPADVVMLIVPEKAELIIELKISPADIDQVSMGQMANLRFSAFNHRTTRQMDGRVVRIAADLSQDPKSGESYYVVRIEIDQKIRQGLGDLTLIPGMPVEAFIQTGVRSAVSYFAEPFTDNFNRIFTD